ncbi:MAG: glycosyl hydrolase 108 family protein, partial [Elainellaceae cyanobacterium]
DIGGATNKGVTTGTYNEYRRRKGLPTQSVRLITQAEVEDIYRSMYWTPSNSQLMVRPLAIVHFDTAVNFGVGGSTLFLQETLGVPADGGFGPITRSALDRSNTSATARRYVQSRIDYRYLRVRQNPSQSVFLNGWLNRDNDLMNYISRM